MYMGRYDEGLQVAHKALDILRRHPPSVFLACVLNAVGMLHQCTGNYNQALVVYDESLQICLSLEELLGQAQVTVNKAYVLENLDRFLEAIDLLEQARALFVDHECATEMARVDLNLGITYTRLGRYDEALAALDQAEQGFAALDNEMEVAVVALYRADLYAEFNLYDELLHVPARDWQVFEERQMQWQAARATLHRAVALRHLGDPLQSEELLERAGDIFARIGDPVWARLTDLEKAALWHEMAKWPRALDLALEVAAFLRKKSIPIRAAGAVLLAARCCLALDRPEEAARFYQEVLDVALELDVPSLLSRARHGLGRVAESQGRLQDAYECFRRAVEEVESLRQRLRVEDFRVGFLEDKLHVYRDAVLLCLRLDRAEEAFAYVERAKSGALVDMLVASLRGPSESEAGEKLLARLHALGEQLNWHYSKLEGSDEEERGPGYFPEAGVWQRIAAVEREATQVWRQFQQAHPFYASLDQSAPSTPTSAQTTLRQDEALLQYYVAGDAVHVFVVGHDGLRGCLPLPCTVGGVADAVDGLDTALRGVSGFDDAYAATTLDALSRQMLGWLYDDLVRPLEPFLSGIARLLVAPDGVLFEIPFHALHDGSRYLIDRFEVAYAPSAGVLRLCRENHLRRGDGPSPPLIVGHSKGGELPHVPREVEAVARAVPDAVVLQDEEASLALLRERSGQSALLHLATHAVFRRDNPLFSALQLAGGDWLRAMDLYTLRLNGALVTLSACETGRHRLRGGDLFGLSRGFFCAGASALVVSLWPVGDVPTALLMERFYGLMAAGEPAAAALRRAQEDLRNFEEGEQQQVRPYAHPFYWAPFCLLGAPEVTM